MITTVFDAAIYPRAAVARAVRDYRGLAAIRVTETDGACVCALDGTRYDEALTCREFENYVLELTVSMGGKADDVY